MTSGSENMLYRGDGFVAAPPPIFSAAACCFARDISFPTAWYACNLLAHCTHGAELIAWRYCGRSLNPLTSPSYTNPRRYDRHQPDASCRRPTLTPTRYDYDHSDAEWSRLAAAGRRQPWRALTLRPSPKP